MGWIAVSMPRSLSLVCVEVTRVVLVDGPERWRWNVSRDKEGQKSWSLTCIELFGWCGVVLDGIALYCIVLCSPFMTDAHQ